MGSGKVGLYVNINAPRLEEIVRSRKEHRWPDDTPVVCPKDFLYFLPHSSCRVEKRKTQSEMFAAYLCQDKPVEYPLCVLDEDVASKFDCLKKLGDFGIAF